MRLLPLLLLAAVLVAGCGTTDRHGSVGDTLQAKTVSARLIEVDGHGLYGVDVGVCNQQDAAIIPWHFQLVLADGRRLHPRYPDLEDNAFDGTRKGCARGWIRYDVPPGARPKELDYRYDGTDGTSQYTHPSEEHDHFVWTL